MCGGFVEHFQLCVVHEGGKATLVPEVHPLSEAAPDVLGPTDPGRALENDGGEDQWPFRVPFSFANAAEFVDEDGQKSTTLFAFRHGVSGRRELTEPLPVVLPVSVVGNSTRQMGPVVGVDVVSICDGK